MSTVKNLEQHNATAEDMKIISALAPVSIMTPMGMIQRALDSNASMEVIEKMMHLQERWEASQARKAFDSAVAEAKANIPVITKNASGHNKIRYANFAAIASTVDPILGPLGLSYRFRTSQSDKAISVTCILSHKAGHFEETTLSGPSDTSGNKNAIQSIGSTLTYLQRYSLVQMLGLAAAEDDDGNTAGMGETINDESLQQLQDLATEVGANMAAFCKLLKVESLEKLPARQFDSAMALLKSKRKSEPKTEVQS